jgi:two-component system LytT family response regulator
VQTENATASSQPESQPSSQRFVVKAGGRILFVKAHEIDWIEAAGDYVYLHVGAKAHLLRESMAVMEDQLDPQQFLRIHRSTIVNADRISEMRPRDNGEYKILLHTGAVLNASRRYRQRVQDFFGGKL